MKTNITSEILLNAGWGEHPCINCLDEGLVNDCYYIKDVNDNHFHLELNHLSNMIGRDWSVHVDNCDYQTIASCDIQTVEQFNAVMELLEIEYRLSL